MGIYASIQANMGANLFGVIIQITSICTGLSADLASWLLLTIMAIVAYFVHKPEVGLGTILSPFLNSLGMRIAMYLAPTTDLFAVQVMYLVVGLTILSFGVVLTIKSQLGTGAYDAFLFAFAHKYKKPYQLVKWILEGIMVIIVLLFKQPLTIATIISIFAVGFLIEWFDKLLDKVSFFRATN